MALKFRKVAPLTIAEKEIADQALAVMGARLNKLPEPAKLSDASREIFLSAMDPRAVPSGVLAYDAISGKVVLRDVFQRGTGVPPNRITIRIGGKATELTLDRQAWFREVDDGPPLGGQYDVSYVLGSIDEASAIAKAAHERWSAAAGRAVNVKNSSFYKQTEEFAEDLSVYFEGKD